DEQVDNLVRTIGEMGIAQLENVGEKISEYDELIDPTEPSDFYYRVTTTLSLVEGLINDLDIKEPVELKPRKMPKKITEEYLEEIDNFIKKIENESVSISKQLEELKDKRKLTDEDKELIQQLKKKKEQLAENIKEDLLVYREALRIEQEIEETKALSGKTSRSYIFEGWVQASKIKEFEEQVLKTTNNNCIIKIDKPNRKDSPPILLKNPKLFKPLEILTVGFSVPNYREIDPTLLMSISFPVFFGIMFADIGHGIILLIPALLGFIVLKRGKPKITGMLGWWIKASPLLLASAVLSIFFGLMFAEVLGFSVHAEPWYVAVGQNEVALWFRGALVAVFQFFDYDGGVKALTDPTYSGYSPLPGEVWTNPVTMEHEYSGAILFSPSHHPFILFALSIIIGVIQISIGLIMGIINKVRKGDYGSAIVDRAFWLWFLLGLVWLAFNRGVNFTQWFETFSFFDASFWLFAAPLAALIFGKLLVHRNLIEGFIGTFEVLVASISNTISYTRILALNQVHAGFSKTFANLGTPLYPDYFGHLVPAANSGYFVFDPTLFYFMFMMLQIGLIMFLEGLLTFINTLRLHWVEWFLKFYEGGGTLFKPFRIKRKYTIPKEGLKELVPAIAKAK
ncbi:MAG: V-type ATP synthase subunit I, partial [Candidatus Odinarchaeia archaeon]